MMVCMGPQDCTMLNDPCHTGVCNNGMCVANPIDCSGLADACNSGSCDPAQGCVKQPANNGGACDDGQFCTTGDTCQGGGCSGSPLFCPPPGNPCFIAQCDENSDQCINVPGNDGTPCDDGDACTQLTTCAGGSCTNGQGVGCISGDGCCPAGCTVAVDSDCMQVLVGSYSIGMGANWTTNPPTETCQEACAIVFGGVPGQYSCSTNGGAVDHLAWVDGYADVTHCMGNGNPVSEGFKLNSNYDCGVFGCSYSAYVSDNCPGSINYCWD
jgi:hypothetical protein